MKKRVLFSLLAIFLAGLGLGGVSMAECTDANAACIDTVGYSTIQEAINEAVDGDTIQVKKDDTLTSILTLNSDKSITLDLDGHALTGSARVISITKGILTIAGDGKMGLQNDGDLIYVNGGSCIIENGTFKGGTIIYAYGASSYVRINGGSFDGTSVGNRTAIHATYNAVMDIYSGDFVATVTNELEGNNKNLKVIYAGGDNNRCDNANAGNALIGGTINVYGGSFYGRLSKSNKGTYHIQGGTFKPTEVAGINCDYEEDGVSCVGGHPNSNWCYYGTMQDMVDNGYVANDIGNGEWTVTKKQTSSQGGSSSSSSSSNNKPSDTAGSGNTNTGTVVPTVDPQGVAANGYTNEMNEAYEFAYANGITTKESIDEAEMLDGLTRIAMAKMLSQYAINVLGKTPADVEVPTFIDVSADLDAEYANGVTLAYKLGIMGINMPDNKFLPYETVTRAQFGTALSRLLFGIEDGEDAYYTTHLAKLKEAGIITNDDPTLEELRGYVMLMLMRSSKGSNTVSTSTEPAVSNENTNTSAHEVANEPKEEQEVEAYFTEAYRKGQIYGRIGDLQRLLKSLGYYNGDINNTFDNNTINAVFDFQIAMGILAADDTSTSRGNVGPKTREVLNQKWAEYKASK